VKGFIAGARWGSRAASEALETDTWFAKAQAEPACKGFECRGDGRVAGAKKSGQVCCNDASSWSEDQTGGGGVSGGILAPRRNMPREDRGGQSGWAGQRE